MSLCLFAKLILPDRVLAESQNLGAGGIHFRRVCEVLTVSIKITTSKGVVIFMEHRNTIDARECPRFKDKT